MAYIPANNDEGNEIIQKFPDCWEMANSKGQTILHIAADVERDVRPILSLKSLG